MIRLILAAMKQSEVDERIVLDDTQVLAVLDKMLKQRRESVTQFTQGNRKDLADKEEAEIKVIQAYMPAQLSEAELDQLVADAVAEPAAPPPSRTWARSWASSNPRSGPGRHGRGECAHQGKAGRLMFCPALWAPGMLSLLFPKVRSEG